MAIEGSFEVNTIINSWNPPFDKTSTVVEYVGEEGEEFDEDIATKKNVFKIVTIKNDYAIIEFSNQYILKKSQYFQSELLVTPQQIKVPKGVELEFSYMWGQKGITKKIKYNGSTRSESQEAPKTQEVAPASDDYTQEEYDQECKSEECECDEDCQCDEENQCEDGEEK